MDSNSFSDMLTSTKILAKRPKRLVWVASSMMRGVPKLEAISNKVCFPQYSCGSCINLTQTCACVCAYALGAKSFVQQKNLRNPGFKFRAPIAQTCFISSIELKWNSKKPLPREIKLQFYRLGQRLWSLAFRACVVIGESPLWRVKRPWRLHWHETNPASYAACEILTRAESPIITFGGRFAIKLLSDEAPEEELESA